MPRPSVGRMVHYVPEIEMCRAAVVTEVVGGSEVDGYIVGLAVFGLDATTFRHDVPQDEPRNVTQTPQIGDPPPSGAAAGTWHWPERVGE